MTPPDVLKAAEPWMQQCGPHDVGLDSVGCACPPDEDPRPIVSRLAAEIERLRDADGLARDALRRSGYHSTDDSGKPLAELIEKLIADARDAVRVCGEESVRLRTASDAARELVETLEEELARKDHYLAMGDQTIAGLIEENRELRRAASVAQLSTVGGGST
jgi:hypothetical protein